MCRPPNSKTKDIFNECFYVSNNNNLMKDLKIKVKELEIKIIELEKKIDDLEFNKKFAYF